MLDRAEAFLRGEADILDRGIVLQVEEGGFASPRHGPQLLRCGDRNGFVDRRRIQRRAAKFRRCGGGRGKTVGGAERAGHRSGGGLAVHQLGRQEGEQVGIVDRLGLTPVVGVRGQVHRRVPTAGDQQRIGGQAAALGAAVVDAVQSHAAMGLGGVDPAQHADAFGLQP